MTTSDPAMIDLGYQREDHDFYPTEEWVTEAAAQFMRRELAWVPKFGKRLGSQNFGIWEPAAGDGAMLSALSKNGKVLATDLVDRGCSLVRSGVDFLATEVLPGGVHAIVTNPPYVLAEEFVRHALALTQPFNGKVAMLLRNEWDCASERQDLLRDHPAYTAKLVLTSRPRWIRGSTGSPRHNYAWYFWDWDCDPEEYPLIAYSQSKKHY